MRLVKIYSILQGARLGKDISLPWNTLTTLVGSGCYFLTHLLAFSLIVRKFSFPGWPVQELWVLFFTFETFTYLTFFFVWTGLVYTVRDIWQGKLDLLISKPISTRFLTMFRGGSLHNLLAAAAGLVLLINVIISNQLQTSLFSWLGFLMSFIVSLWIIHCLSIIFISINFFVGKTESTAGAIFQFQETMKYPATAYSQLSPWIQILVLPTSLLTTIPTMILLGKNNWNLLSIYLVVFILLTIASDFFWNNGLRNYSSASS